MANKMLPHVGVGAVVFRGDAVLQARVKRLSSIVQRRASELNIAAEVLATRRELEGIARGRDADVLHGWRRQALGEELLAATAAS